MGNIPVPPEVMRLNMWTLDKKLLLWRTLGISACIIGTAVYMRPLEPYFEAPIFSVLVPSFITGYILVHASDIMLLVMKADYIYLETCFMMIGAIGSLVCGVYQLYKWIDWMVNLSYDFDRDYDIPELVLALAFMLHFVCVCAVMIHRIFERRGFNADNTART